MYVNCYNNETKSYERTEEGSFYLDWEGEGFMGEMTDMGLEKRFYQRNWKKKTIPDIVTASTQYNEYSEPLSRLPLIVQNLAKGLIPLRKAIRWNTRAHLPEGYCSV